MIKFSEIKVGDFLVADYEGDKRLGEVTQLHTANNQVRVDNGVQEFWYETNQLSEIPVDESVLMKMKFHKHVNDDGTIKYMKGAFRMLVPKEGDFSRMEIWYRDETRHISHPIPVHVLQNHFYEMTKVHLNEDSFD